MLSWSGEIYNISAWEATDRDAQIQQTHVMFK